MSYRKFENPFNVVLVPPVVRSPKPAYPARPVAYLKPRRPEPYTMTAASFAYKRAA